MAENVVQELEDFEKLLVPKVDVSDLLFDEEPIAGQANQSDPIKEDGGKVSNEMSVESFIKSSREMSDQKPGQAGQAVASSDDQVSPADRSAVNGSQKRKKKRQWPNVAMKTPLQILNEMFALNHHEVRFVEDYSYGSDQNGLFRAKCIVRGRPFFGIGSNKQAAKQSAAKAALDQLLLEERRCSGRNNPTIGQIPPPSGHRYHAPGAPYFRDYYVGPDLMRGPRPSFPPSFPSPGYSQYPPMNPNFPEGPRGYYSDPYYRDPYEYRPPPPHQQPYPPQNIWPRGPAGDFGQYPMPPLPQRPYEDYTGYTFDGPHGQPPIESIPVPAPRAPPVQGNSSDEPLAKRPAWVAGPKPPSNNSLRFDEDDAEDFITFDSINREEKEDDEDVKNRKNIPKGKEKILLKVTAINDQDNDNLVSNHPVSLIHELHPDLTWEFTGTESTGKTITCFKMNLLIHGQVFEGSGKTKKLAKYDAAKNALNDLYNILIPEPPTQAQLKLMREALQSDTNTSLPNKPSVIRNNLIQTDESLLLDQSLANKIGLAVLSKSKEVIDTLTETKKWNVLAAIVLTSDINSDYLKVVCVTSGTKCVKGDALSLTGSSVNDCHAEILARRCFIHFLFQQLNQLADCGFKGELQ